MGKDDLRQAKYVIDIGLVPSLPVAGSDMMLPGVGRLHPCATSAHKNKTTMRHRVPGVIGLFLSAIAG